MQIPDEKVKELKTFVDILKLHPELVQDPRMGFFRDYLQALGATLPEEKKASAGQPEPQAAKPESAKPEPEASPEPESDPESDVDLDMEGVIEPDNDGPQEMGDPTKVELSEEENDQFSAKRSEALHCFSEGQFKKAIEVFTEAIKINANNAVVFAKRGACFLKLEKPNACIEDCSRAIELNPDSAPAYKFRGRAQRLLGKFVEAAKDLRTACKIDFDEQSDEWLKEVTPNAKKIEEHQRKMQRSREEKEIRLKKERIQKAREERGKAAKAEQEMPGFSMPSAGRGGGGGGIPAGLQDILGDPELLQAFQDPEVSSAFMDISQNPANIMKYQNNPKVMALAAKLAEKAGGGMPGMAGGMPGMAGGMPGMGFPGMGGFGGAPGAAPGGASEPSKPPPSTDDLD